MKKIYILLGLVPMILLMFFKRLVSMEGFLVILTAAVIFMMICAYLYFEKSNMGTKDIALISTLSAFAAVGRVPFSIIPNVQPTTFIVAIAGLVFGPIHGFLIGATAAFVSNIFLGQGPHTPWQMFAWGVIGVTCGFIGRWKKPSTEVFAIILLISGFIFGWIMNIWHIVGFVRPININTILLAYLNSFTFDLMHGVGNFLFVMVFYESFYKILYRFKKRLSITYIN